jgi:NAD(P)-dependent dehydrogenase (short-subunit alcohol dehydrogenase family)
MSYTAGPLYDVRALVASVIETALGVDVVVYPNPTANFATPCVILDGAGWAKATGCAMTYQMRVTCIVSNQAGTAVTETEELTRQVWDAIAQANFSTAEVPAPGVVQLGDRDYPACQFTVPMMLNPL